MRSLRYLNTILTVIAVLLSVHVWLMWTSASAARPDLAFVESAHAQALPNAAAQRIEQTNELKQVNENLKKVIDVLQSGKVRVQLQASSTKPQPATPGAK